MAYIVMALPVADLVEHEGAGVDAHGAAIEQALDPFAAMRPEAAGHNYIGHNYNALCLKLPAAGVKRPSEPIRELACCWMARAMTCSLACSADADIGMALYSYGLYSYGLPARWTPT